MYGKIFRQMYRGTLATVGPWQALVTFQQMIVLADAQGIVDMTAESLSRETTIPLDIIRLGIAALELPDPDSRTPGHDGCRIIRLSETRDWGWRIVNYEHYRKLRSEEERRDYHRQYWREKRSKRKDSTNSTGAQQPQQNSSGSTHAVCSMQEAESRKKTERRDARASRLPDDFALTEVRQKVAEKEQVDPQRTFEKFCDYWRSVGGARGRKIDWDATWRNWCRSESERRPMSGGKRKAARSADEIEAAERARGELP
jgi:hypothetical protein